MKALYYASLFLAALGAIWAIGYVVARSRTRKLSAEVARLERENMRLKSALDGSDNEKDRRIGGYERMIDVLQLEVAGWRGNELSLNDNRQHILQLIEVNRPRTSNEGNRA